MKKRFLVILLGLVSSAVGFTGILYLIALLLRPDVVTPRVQPSARELATVNAARMNAQQIDSAKPPVIAQTVDYGRGSSAAWWPKHEAPVLAEMVREGVLPNVTERVGVEPVVMNGVEGVGRYGGTWHRLVNSTQDFSTVHWRLSASNLVRWSPQGYPLVPHLAKAWEVSADRRVYTFALRRGMRWSDGHPVTSEDICYWYEHEVKYFEVQPRFLRSGQQLGRVEKIDDLHVRFIFAEPNALFLEQLASVGMNYDDYTEHIVPAHYLRSYHPEIGEPELIRRAMVAFQLASPVAVYRKIKFYLNPAHPRLWPWIIRTDQSGSATQTFVRNPYYYVVDVKGNQLPYLDRLVLEIKTNNLIAVSAANGEPSMQDRHIRYDDHSALLGSAARNGYEVYHWKPSTQSLFTIFPNLNRRVDPSRPETKWKHALLNDARFRQALSLAINRRDIIAADYNGQTEPAQTAPPPDSPYHHPRLYRAFVEHDPVRAGRLLDELGLERRDAAGFRLFPDGTRMTFLLNVTDYTSEGPAQFVISDWAKIGIRAILRNRARKLFEQEKLTYEHDLTVWTGESEFYPLVEPRNFVPTYNESLFAPGFGVWFQHSGLHGDGAARRPNAVAPPEGHPLRRAMEILEAAQREPEEEKRIARFREIQEIAADNVWTISLSSPPPQLVVVKNGFRNVPRTAVFGAKFQTPGNAGLETYFWDEPTDPPAVLAQTKREILAGIGGRGAPVAGESRHADTAAKGRAFFMRCLITGVLVALVFIGVRHRFVGRRIVLMIPTAFLVSAIVFTLVQLPPGDYVSSRVARLEMEGTASSDELAAELRRSFHLDEPMLQRYARWIGLRWFATFRHEDRGMLQGHLGLSMEQEKSVNEVIGQQVGLTVLVTVSSVVFTWAVALPIGIFSATRRGSAGDNGIAFLGFVAMSVPSFLLALVLLYLGRSWFGMSLGGLYSPEFAAKPGWSWAKFYDLLQHLWLPVVALGLGSAAGLGRLLRANLLDELKKPYVTTARAKGVRPLRLLLRYPLRLALNPFVSGLGGLLPQLISGGAIVAMVLSLPMLGPTLLDALLAEDAYLAASMLMLLSLLGMTGTLLSDLLLVWIDPRVRFGAGKK